MLVLLLLFASLLSTFLGMFVDAVVIGVVIILNAFLGFWQEFKAEKAIAALRNLTTSRITVIRNGSHTEIPVSSIVPGDIVMLEEVIKSLLT
jgi:Ca2+-transporting ATPase